eukprot:437169_1
MATETKQELTKLLTSDKLEETKENKIKPAKYDEESERVPYMTECHYTYDDSDPHLMYVVLVKLYDYGISSVNINTVSVINDFSECVIPNSKDTVRMLRLLYPKSGKELNKLTISLKGAKYNNVIEYSKADWKSNDVQDIKDIKEQKHLTENNENNQPIFGIYVEKIEVDMSAQGYIPLQAANTFLNGRNILTRDKLKYNEGTIISECKEAKLAYNIISYYDDERQRRIQSALSHSKYNIHDCQIYYCDFNKFLYMIGNDTVRQSKAFCGSLFDDQIHVENKDHGDYYGQFFRNKTPYYYQNITEFFWINVRYKQLKEKCLYGQDNEFNIFRSLCFSDHEMKVFKLSIGILCLILQVFLTVGIVMEVSDNWDIDAMFDNDTMIIIISFFVFSFISFSYGFTVYKFMQFYDNMLKINKISLWIIIFDFISNIAVGFVICFVSFAYLLQSPSIGDVVLNAFAITFIIELDDLANLFESDEDELLHTDFCHLKLSRCGNPGPHYGDYDQTIRKRRITISFVTIGLSLLLLLLTPLFIILAAMMICYALVQYIRTYMTKEDVCYDKELYKNRDKAI